MHIKIGLYIHMMLEKLKCCRYSIVRSIDHQKSNRTGDALFLFREMLRGWGKIGERFSGLGGQAPERPIPVAYFSQAFNHLPQKK